MSEVIGLLEDWRLLALGYFLLGFVPGACLRLIVRIYPPDDPRRTEPIKELGDKTWWERPLFLFEQLQIAIFDGLPERWRKRDLRWRLASLGGPPPTYDARRARRETVVSSVVGPTLVCAGPLLVVLEPLIDGRVPVGSWVLLPAVVSSVALIALLVFEDAREQAKRRRVKALLPTLSTPVQRDPSGRATGTIVHAYPATDPAGPSIDDSRPLVLVDLDHIATIINPLGRRGAARLLAALLQRLAHASEAIETVLYLNDDQFALLIDRAADLDEVSRQVAAALHDPFQVRDEQFSVGASLRLLVRAG